jgi:hypothetical protein
VGDQHRAAQELQHGRQHLRQPRRAGDHRGGDARERDDAGRHAGARVDECGELTDPLATTHLHRADLGDRVVPGRPARGLQVEHDERDLAQRGAELVERQLGGAGRHGRGR